MVPTSTTPTANPNTQPQPRRSRKWLFWLTGGVVAVTVLLVGLVAVVAAVAFTKSSPKPAELAQVVARPLIAEGTIEPVVNESEMYAALSSKLADAKRLGQGQSEVATVAREYGDALESLKALIEEAPTVQPLVRAGLETWKGSLDNSDGGFLIGLLGVGGELSRFSEFSDRMSTIHSRVVACRLRIAEIAAKQALPESAADTVNATFTEARGLGTVASDTLALRNVSGERLTHVMVVTELTGRSGDRFSNLFYAESWDPNQVLLAICRSERPGRETVHNVVQVRFRVIANERTSRLAIVQVD